MMSSIAGHRETCGLPEVEPKASTQDERTGCRACRKRVRSERSPQRRGVRDGFERDRAEDCGSLVQLSTGKTQGYATSYPQPFRRTLDAPPNRKRPFREGSPVSSIRPSSLGRPRTCTPNLPGGPKR